MNFIFFNYILIKKTKKVKRNPLEYLQKKNPVYRKGRDGSPSTRSTRQIKSTKTQVKRLSSLEEFKK